MAESKPLREDPPSLWGLLLGAVLGNSLIGFLVVTPLVLAFLIGSFRGFSGASPLPVYVAFGSVSLLACFGAGFGMGRVPRVRGTFLVGTLLGTLVVLVRALVVSFAVPGFGRLLLALAVACILGGALMAAGYHFGRRMRPPVGKSGTSTGPQRT